MILDSLIVAVVVAGAVAYLAWNFRPRRRRAPAACAACPKSHEVRQAVPVRTRWTG